MLLPRPVGWGENSPNRISPNEPMNLVGSVAPRAPEWDVKE